MAVESIGTIYSVNIPGLTDSADIQAAFQAYHYGAYTSVAATNAIASGGITYWLKEIETDIATLEARPSSGGAATSAEPVLANFAGSTSIPNGFIWVDADALTTSSVLGATAVFTNNAPTSNLTAGVIWVDKDATTSTVGNPFIPQAIIAAKGDLLAGSANDTVVVLTVGSNGTYLKADSSTASGLTWAAAGDVTLTGTETLTNKTLTTPIINGPTITATGQTPVIHGILLPATHTIIFEGATDNDFETTLQVTDPTADRTVSLPDATTTLVGRDTTDTLTNKTLTNPILIAPEERLTVTATTSTGTINFNLDTAGTLYHTANAAANHTLNFRFSANTSLSSALTTNDSITAVFMNTNGATAYYPNVITVDGATSGVSIKYQGGTAYTAGNASSIDAYVFNIIKTAATSYTVLAAQTKFA